MKKETNHYLSIRYVPKSDIIGLIAGYFALRFLYQDTGYVEGPGTGLEDGTFLNAEIIKQGSGHAYAKFLFKYMQKFRIYERKARIRKVGLWK